MMSIKTDLRLITALEDDGRSSYAQLAKSLGIGISTVARRVEYLKKKGVLTIRAVPNPIKINHTAAAIIGINVAMDKIDDVCNRLKSIFNVNMTVTTFGRFNLLAGVYSSTWEKLHTLISSEFSSKGGIYETEIFFAKEIKKPFSHRLEAGHVEQTTGEIDEVDQRIIELLTEDGRRSGLSIANKLNISASAVSKRLNRLLKEGIIHVRAQINPTKFGYHSNAIVFLRVTPGRADEICANLHHHIELNTILSLINGYDIYINMIAQDSASLFEFIKKQMTIASGILSIETLVCGEVIKRYYNAFKVNELVSKVPHSKLWGTTGKGAALT